MTPVFIMGVMLVVQAALLFHARSLVTAAAADGARATQAEHGTEHDGVAVVEALIGDGGLLEDPEVTVSRSASEVNVTISAEVRSLVPFWRPHITATSAGPVEVFVAESERR